MTILASPALAQAPPTVEQAIGAQVLGRSADWASAIDNAMTRGMQLSGGMSIGTDTGNVPRVTTETENLPPRDGLPAGQRTATNTVTSRTAGPRSYSKVSIRVRETRGATVLNGAGDIEIEIDLCPDANGEVKLRMDVSHSGDNAIANAAGTGGASFHSRYRISGVGQVGDDAKLQGARLEAQVDTSNRGGIRTALGPAAGQSLTASNDIDGTLTVTTRNDEGVQALDSYGGQIRSSDSMSDAQREAIGKLFATLARQFANGAFEAAEQRWRSGYCLEINVTPPAIKDGKAYTQPRQTLSFTASVRHKFEGADLPQPIDISFSGKERASPDRIDKAPGQIAYTSGDKRGDEGAISMRTVSRRGIADAKASFDNARRMYELKLSVGPYFVIDTMVCDIEKPFEVRPRGGFSGVLVRFRPTSDSAGSFVEGGRAYGAVWNGSGNYTIAWSDEYTGRFVATNPNTAKAGAGRSNNPNDMMTGTVTRRRSSVEDARCP